VPRRPATVGAYLASLAGSHAPTTIRRRLSALGKMHRFNDLPWNPAHRDIQGPLQGVLRMHGRPVQEAAARPVRPQIGYHAVLECAAQVPTGGHRNEPGGYTGGA
jgi:hypothetical protein